MCRLVLFRFASDAKDPTQAQELASEILRPAFDTIETVTLSRFLGSTQPNVNFPIGNGLGVAVIVENATGSAIEAPAASAYLAVHGVELAFSPRPIDESVVD
jgi:hypothetical protein